MNTKTLFLKENSDRKDFSLKKTLTNFSLFSFKTSHVQKLSRIKITLISRFFRKNPEIFAFNFAKKKEKNFKGKSPKIISKKKFKKFSFKNSPFKIFFMSFQHELSSNGRKVTQKI